MTSLTDLFWAARYPPADPTHLSFKGKAVLVTGANSGLGYQAAVKYAKLGASPLILAVRTTDKGEAAKASIIQETQCPADIFIIETVDLVTFASVKEFVHRLNQRVPKLHVVQLVAGICAPSYATSPEGYEMALQINVLSTALMALLLLPQVRQTATEITDWDGLVPHISFVNSVAHLEVKPEWIPDDQSLVQRINGGAKFNQVENYYLIKLAGMFVMRGLTERLGADKVVINASCPGMCKTNMGHDFPLVQRLFMALFYIPFGRSAEQGSRTLVSATATGPEGHAKLWTNDKFLS